MGSELELAEERVLSEEMFSLVPPLFSSSFTFDFYLALSCVFLSLFIGSSRVDLHRSISSGAVAVAAGTPAFSSGSTTWPK